METNRKKKYIVEILMSEDLELEGVRHFVELELKCNVFSSGPAVDWKIIETLLRNNLKANDFINPLS